MQEILNQLGELVLGSVPTILFFVFLVAAYGLLVSKPLQKTLEERRVRTTGAMDEARRAIADAENKAGEYERRLREARATIFEGRQKRLKQWNAERDKSLEESRKDAQHRTGVAREAVERSGEEAKQQLESATGQLSDQILRVILPQGHATVQG